jgi:hypothetical protein
MATSRITAARVSSHRASDLSHHGGTCRVESSHMATSRITAAPVESSHRASDLSHHGGTSVESRRVTSHATSRITAAPVESSQVTSHHMATSRITAETVESQSHRVTWRHLASRRHVCRVTESHGDLSYHGGNCDTSHITSHGEGAKATHYVYTRF